MYEMYSRYSSIVNHSQRLFGHIMHVDVDFINWKKKSYRNLINLFVNEGFYYIVRLVCKPAFYIVLIEMAFVFAQTHIVAFRLSLVL